jgi:hypothetical protein
MSETSDPGNGTPKIVGAADGELPSNTRDVAQVIAYDLPEDEQPAGMKVRWVWTVVTGKRAQQVDARHDAWLVEALQWCRDNRPEPEKSAN